MTEVADQVLSALGDFVLPFDARAAVEYAEVRTAPERTGAPMSVFDSQIAAICGIHRAALATRNTKDLAGTGLALIDPWTDEA